jgi:hypothetical protein
MGFQPKGYGANRAIVVQGCGSTRGVAKKMGSSISTQSGLIGSILIVLAHPMKQI